MAKLFVALLQRKETHAAASLVPLARRRLAYARPLLTACRSRRLQLPVVLLLVTPLNNRETFQLVGGSALQVIS
jgi:hypothetical protein